MKLIVGLGNIGKEYDNTRHNIGFMVVDELAKRFSVNWKTDKFSLMAEKFLQTKIILIKPQTYMNLSGNAVGHFANYYDIDPTDIAVVQDDLDLPCGKLRIRQKGSAGGHRGILSIVEHLNSVDFNRFKIGIGHPDHSERAVVKHVLEKFNKQERPLIDEAIAKTADALEYWINNNVSDTMNKFN